MRLHKKFVCQRVRQNNGMVEVLFTGADNHPSEQNEHVLVDLRRARDFVKDRVYWIDIQPAFPFDPDKSS
jgi:hypothetical protein